MPQLNSEDAAKVAGAVNPFALIDDGVYLAVLNGEVTVKASSTSGTDTWIWPFALVPVDGMPFGNKKIDHRTWTSDASFWRLKETFDAFGVPSSTNTDTLEGKTVRLHIIQKDNYKGELDDETGLVKLVNDIKAVLPAEGKCYVDEAAKARREKLREEAKKALLENPVTDADDEILF